jgi:hypothetical protein
MTAQKKSITYNSVTVLCTIAVLFILINWLQWPLTASLILGATLFFQLMYLFKKGADYWVKAKEKGLNYDMIQNLRPDMSSLERNAEADIQ